MCAAAVRVGRRGRGVGGLLRVVGVLVRGGGMGGRGEEGVFYVCRGTREGECCSAVTREEKRSAPAGG